MKNYFKKVKRYFSSSIKKTFILIYLLVLNVFLAVFFLIPDLPSRNENQELLYLLAGFLFSFATASLVFTFIITLNKKASIPFLLISLFSQIFLLILFFAVIYKIYGLHDGDKNVLVGWDIAVYFSVVTWTTLGYGDYTAIAELKLIAALEAFIGYIYSGLLIAILAQFFMNRIKDEENHCES